MLQQKKKMDLFSQEFDTVNEPTSDPVAQYDTHENVRTSSPQVHEFNNEEEANLRAHPRDRDNLYAVNSAPAAASISASPSTSSGTPHAIIASLCICVVYFAWLAYVNFSVGWTKESYELALIVDRAKSIAKSLKRGHVCKNDTYKAFHRF
jgi:hypothetical protein